MKRTLLYILLFACALASIRCTEETTDPGNIDYEEANYTSYWYYNYEAMEIIDYAALELESNDLFNPYAVAQRGDTLFVANTASGHSLILYSKKAKKPLRTIKTWTMNGAEKKFTSTINAIVVTDERLYVAEQQSLIHVFALPDMEYYSCIGDGNWNSGKLFQAQAMTVKDGWIFTRSKDGNIRFFKEADVKPETYQSLKYYRQAGPGAGNSSNNNFAAHYMEPDEEGHILLTGYEAKSIRVLDPSLIGDDFKSGTNIDLDDLTWALPFKPKTFAKSPERMYATGDNDAINVYDYEQKAWVKTFKALKGFSLTKPERICRESDTSFWVSDVTKRTLVRMGVFKSEIREYSRVNDHVVRVETALTRGGETEGGFYVDLRTHEIVDEPGIE